MTRPLALLLLLAACDSPKSDGTQLGPDTADATSDTAPLFDVEDAQVPDTQVPDTQAPETAQPDTSPSVCTQGCVPAITATAPRGVTFQQFPSGAPPALSGGDQPTGQWVLRAIEVRPNGTFAEGVDVQLSNAGQTAGRANFSGDAIAMALDLHLTITVDVLGRSGSDTARQEVAIGGCHAVSGARLVGQLGTCARGFPPNTAAPSALDFQLDSQLTIGLPLSREQLIGLLPEEDRASADLAITGPLYLLARFERE